MRTGGRGGEAEETSNRREEGGGGPAFAASPTWWAIKTSQTGVHLFLFLCNIHLQVRSACWRASRCSRSEISASQSDDDEKRPCPMKSNHEERGSTLLRKDGTYIHIYKEPYSTRREPIMSTLFTCSNYTVRCIMIHQVKVQLSVHTIMAFRESRSIAPGDWGSTVVKVLCYKSEGRWFDSRWCHWNFSLI